MLQITSANAHLSSTYFLISKTIHSMQSTFTSRFIPKKGLPTHHILRISEDFKSEWLQDMQKRYFTSLVYHRRIFAIIKFHKQSNNLRCIFRLDKLKLVKYENALEITITKQDTHKRNGVAIYSLRERWIDSYRS